MPRKQVSIAAGVNPSLTAIISLCTYASAWRNTYYAKAQPNKRKSNGHTCVVEIPTSNKRNVALLVLTAVSSTKRRQNESSNSVSGINYALQMTPSPQHPQRMISTLLYLMPNRHCCSATPNATNPGLSRV
eukprot:9597690-Ditylum_brightwellii.AAC.1